MAAAVFSKSVGTVNLRGCDNSSASSIRKSSSRSISKSFAIDVRLFQKGICSSSQSKLHVVHASTSHAPVMDQISCCSDNTIHSNEKPSSELVKLWDKFHCFALILFVLKFVVSLCVATKYEFLGFASVESALILIRHGESLWNEKNLFTGCVDVPLTKKGIDEAIEAGLRIRNIPVDMIYTSTLIRAQMTAMLAMTQHCNKKVPDIIFKICIEIVCIYWFWKTREHLFSIIIHLYILLY